MPPRQLLRDADKGTHTIQKNTLESAFEQSRSTLIEEANKTPYVFLKDKIYCLLERTNLTYVVETEVGLAVLEIDTQMMIKDRSISFVLLDSAKIGVEKIKKLRKVLKTNEDRDVHDALSEIYPRVNGEKSRGHFIHTILKLFSTEAVLSDVVSACEKANTDPIDLYNLIMEEILFDSED